MSEELALELPLVDKENQVELTAEDEIPAKGIEQTFTELREYSRRSDKAEEFERSVAQAFSFLGFAAQHIGGAGNTDVVADAKLPGKDAYRIIIDAKSSANGVISDNAIKFDALKDHQRKHRANFGVVVGPDFTGRVREWAANNSFTLLTTDDLINLMLRHSRHPLTLNETRSLFQRGDDDLADIEEQYAASARAARLLARIVELLHDEANEEDPLLDGYISLENVNYALRKELSPRPAQSAVEECLQFLAHDLVRGATRNGNKYKLADAPANVVRRLYGLGVDIGEASAR